jgi:bifunctional DNase/RNase
MDVLSVARVMRCECAHHTWVILHDPTGERTVQVLVGADIGRAIAAELSELPGAHAEAFDLMRLVFSATGVSASSLTLRQDGEMIRASLNVRGLRGLAVVDVDPCNGLLAACRMKLPILVSGQPPAGGGIPDVYHPLLESLGFEGCGGPDAA